MRNPYAGKQIWFLTGSQALYGPEFVQQVADQSQKIVELLNAGGEIPVPVMWQPVLTDRDSIRKAMLAADADDACVGVIVWMHTFSPAKMWIFGLDVLCKPMLHLHTQANVELPWDTIDMDFMNLNQAAHGDREFGYIATRLSVPRTIVVGHASQPRVRSEVAVWARACVAWNDLHRLRVCRFGDNMRNVAVTEGDKTEVEHKLGVAVNTWPVNELVDAINAVTETQVSELLATYDADYRVAPELQADGARRAALVYAARQEAGLRAFLEVGNFGAFTDTFEDLGALEQLPGLAVQRLMAEGYGFGAEGDWKTAILVRAAKVMAWGLPGGASLMEDYTYELTPGKEKILGAHMLEICPTLTTAQPSLEIHPLSIGNRSDPVRLVFDVDPGPALVVSMSDMRDRFRLTANTVNVVGPDQPLPKLPVARAVWQPEPDFVTSATCWLTAGAAHHTVMTTALGVEHFAALARIAGIELAVIDAHTTLRDFEQTLRTNAVYYAMNAGTR